MPYSFRILQIPRYLGISGPRDPSLSRLLSRHFRSHGSPVIQASVQVFPVPWIPRYLGFCLGISGPIDPSLSRLLSRYFSSHRSLVIQASVQVFQFPQIPRYLGFCLGISGPMDPSLSRLPSRHFSSHRSPVIQASIYAFPVLSLGSYLEFLCRKMTSGYIRMGGNIFIQIYISFKLLRQNLISVNSIYLQFLKNS